MSCAGKPLAGWLARDGIQESREACGGHGYLKSKLAENLGQLLCTKMTIVTSNLSFP